MNKFTQILFLILFIFMVSTIIIMFTKIIHPIIITILLLFMVIVTCLYFSSWKVTYLYAILIFLMMISGLLVIYGYFTSLISNESKFQKKDILYSTLLLMSSYSLSVYMHMTLNNLQIYTQFSYPLLDSTSLNKIFSFKFENITYMYIYPLNNFTLMTMLFMLLAFILIIKINNSSMSMTLRKIN
uniref:NADH dehydrogenase subunit 6 n=1 Tax=Harpegnathos venator TaxID=610381 RepID=UPI002A80CF60|nr:NADH dehydrogenase subunit 6 [Harpegnathos venator]WON66588.1 NADH dehydrogenase subunit 6 [Harpegnathos venator]